MSTKSKAHKVEESNFICQGDIFQNVTYTYIASEEDETVSVNEIVFPYAIVISQACDVKASDEMIVNKRGKLTKYMPSILMCPIYDEKAAKIGEGYEDVVKDLGIMLDMDKKVFDSKDITVSYRDWHYRLHKLDIVVGNDTQIENAVIDFKHYFTVPPQYLREHVGNRIFRLDGVFAEQITLKFATYLSRVAIPD